MCHDSGLELSNPEAERLNALPPRGLFENAMRNFVRVHAFVCTHIHVYHVLFHKVYTRAHQTVSAKIRKRREKNAK